jgi:Tol biopolymer transport system component
MPSSQKGLIRMPRASDRPFRSPRSWHRLAISMVAAAFVTTACGQTGAPGTAEGRTALPSIAPTTSAVPSSTISAAPLPGGRIAYVQFIGETASLFTTNPDGTDTVALLPGTLVNPPRWSPDGRAITVVSDDRDGRVSIGLVDPDGSHYVRFAHPDATLELGCFAWSPDGSRLACEGWDETDISRNGIYTVRSSDGGDLTRVTTSPNGSHDIPTDYSPDGHRLVFGRMRLPDVADTTLMVVNVDGSGARALSDRRLAAGRWSPDGQTILTDADDALLLVPVDGGGIRTIDIAAANGLETSFFGSWSPDGDWIVFSGRASKSVDLYIVRADGTNLHQLTDTPVGKWEEGADWTVGAP